MDLMSITYWNSIQMFQNLFLNFVVSSKLLAYIIMSLTLMRLYHFVEITAEFQDSPIIGVLEFTPYGNSSDPKLTFENNLKIFSHVIKKAHLNKVDLIIFPEYGLTSLILPTDKNEFLSFMQIVGKIYSNPCYNQRNLPETWVVEHLSCLARENHVYLVVNLGEVVGDLDEEDDKNTKVMYNTNVVFDRRGRIIARYRKYNLFYEGFYSKPDPELVTFETDFNVKFGLIICFDIMFDYPTVSLVKKKKINYIIHNEAWIDELPYFLAHQTEDSFAKGLQVTFMSAGYHNLNTGKVGSGIFRPTGSSVLKYQIKSPGLFIFPLFENSSFTTKLISVEDFKMVNNYRNADAIRWTKGLSEEHKILAKNMSIFVSIPLDKKSDNVHVCDENFCCYLSYAWDIKPSRLYKLIATKQDNKIGAEYSWPQEVCSIVLCQSNDIQSCSEHVIDDYVQERLVKYEISANFSTDFIAPSVLKTDLQLHSKQWHWYRTPIGKHIVFCIMYCNETFNFSIQSITLYGKVASSSIFYSFSLRSYFIILFSLLVGRTVIHQNLFAY